MHGRGASKVIQFLFLNRQGLKHSSNNLIGRKIIKGFHAKNDIYDALYKI
jgi:hypothetical protein